MTHGKYTHIKPAEFPMKYCAKLQLFRKGRRIFCVLRAKNTHVWKVERNILFNKTGKQNNKGHYCSTKILILLNV
jgi:hypothetical protein